MAFFIFAFGEFYQFNLSSCIRQQNSLTAQFVSFSFANLANIAGIIEQNQQINAIGIEI